MRGERRGPEDLELHHGRIVTQAQPAEPWLLKVYAGQMSTQLPVPCGYFHIFWVCPVWGLHGDVAFV